MMRHHWHNPKRIVWALLLALGAGAWLTAGSDGQVPASAARPTERTATCTDVGCHDSLLENRFMHGPAAQRKCEACHTYDEPREHRFVPIDDSELCGMCHTLNHRDVVHEPVKEGNCTGCHDPHGSDHRMMLHADPAAGLCDSCHGPPVEEGGFLHGPFATGACILCHEPHSSWQPKLLVKPTRELCTDCHSEVGRTGPGVHVHAAIDQGCTSCHDAHASEHRYMLHQQAPGLCVDCHGQTIDDIQASAVAHGAVQAEGGCGNCHLPHTSTLPGLQRSIEPRLCLSCHDRTMHTDTGRTLTNMARLLDDQPNHHGPIREGSCSACHQPHAGERASLLTHGYPPDFYAPFEMDRYELCFNCHMPQMVTRRDGRGVTRFRDGQRNLHWLHVNQQKGRTCRACHEVHASSRPFHVRESVPFGAGGWLLEINFHAADDGGSCAPGCHAEASYIRGEVEAENDRKDAR